MMQRLRFILFYARRDLFPMQWSGGSSGRMLSTSFRNFRQVLPTLLNILSLIVLIVTVLILWGVTSGAGRQLDRMVLENPRVLQIDAFLSTQFDSVNIIRDDLLARIGSLRSDGRTTGTPDEGVDGRSLVKSVFGWRDVSMRFFDAEGRIMPDYADGRTYARGDPLIDLLTFTAPEGAQRARADEPGLVVSRRFLRGVGYPDTVPSQLDVEYMGVRSPIPVLAVATDAWARDFMLSDEFWADFRDGRWQPIKRYRRVYLGPLPTEQAQALAKVLSAAYDADLWTVDVTERAGSDKWVAMQSQVANGVTGGFIDGMLMPGIRQVVTDSNLAIGRLHHDMGPPLPPDRAEQFEPLSNSYTSLTVYVHDVSCVEPTAAWLVEQGLGADMTVVEDIAWAKQIKSFTRGIGWAVMATVCLLAAANLYLTSTQSVQRRTPEVGILKSFGAGPDMILMIELTKAVMIWLAAVPVGIALAVVLGDQANHFLIVTFGLASDLSLFVVDGFTLATAGGGALAISLAATSAAAYMLSTLRPAVALRERE